MQDPIYRVRFKSEPSVLGVTATWSIEITPNTPHFTGVEVRANNDTELILLENRVQQGVYGKFRLGNTIIHELSQVEGSYTWEDVSLDDLLGVRLYSDSHDFRWSTNQYKPPFMHVSPKKVFSRFDQDVEVSTQDIELDTRGGYTVWRVTGE